MWKKYLILVILASVSFPSQSKIYFGFDLGHQSIESAVDLLYQEQAKFTQVAPNHKTHLPLVVVHDSESLEQYGSLKEGLLLFNQENILYGIDLQYYDDGSTFDELKNVLDRKYKQVETKSQDLVKIYRYQDTTDATLEIELVYDNSQSLQDKVTRLKFYNKDLLAKVEDYNKV